jgi:hypothetical protein
MTLPIFYSLPATELDEGMSTDDGQDVLDVSVDPDGSVIAHVYTPRSDDPDLDEENRGETEARMYSPGERVDLAVFEDTQTDGRDRPGAQEA